MGQPLRSPEFKAVAAYSKIIAKRKNRTRLDIECFLGGLATAAQLADWSGFFACVAQDRELLSTYLEPDLDMTVSQDNPETESMPLDESLRKLIGKYQSDHSLEGIFCALTAAARNLACGVGAEKRLLSWKDIPEIRTLVERAGHFQIRLGSEKLAIEHIAVALQSALIYGSPSIGIRGMWHAKVHAEAFHAVLRSKNWVLPTEQSLSCCVESQDEPVLDEGLRQTLETIPRQPDPLFGLVDAALETCRKYQALERTAYHEAGHAFACMVLQPHSRILEVSIRPQGTSQGRLKFEDGFDPAVRMTLDEMQRTLIVLLAGRGSEEKKFGPHGADCGATNDIGLATTIAWLAITEQGLDPIFGPIALKVVSDGGMIQNGWLFELAQKRLYATIASARGDMQEFVKEHWPAIDKGAVALLQRETLSEVEFRQVVGLTDPIQPAPLVVKAAEDESDDIPANLQDAALYLAA